MRILNKNKITLIISLVVICVFFPLSASHAKSADKVSMRELLILTLVSYSNIPNKSVSETIKVTDWNYFDIGNDTICPEEMDGWEISRFEINDNNDKEGFSIFVFEKGNNMVIVPRGTDGGLVTENWKYLCSRGEHPQARYLKDYVLNLISSPDYKNSKIYICGHSLGGYLALYATGLILDSGNTDINYVKTVTFNGLGLGKNTNPKILSALYKANPQKIVNYRISWDVVSKFGIHITEPITLNLINSPILKIIKLWQRIPCGAAHTLSQFLVHEPFLAEWQIEKTEKSQSVFDKTMQTDTTKDKSNESKVNQKSLHKNKIVNYETIKASTKSA